VVLDGNRAYGYWNDGAAVDLGAYPDFEPASGLAVGSHAGDSAHFCGLVDEVRISAVARSADWVRATYRTTVENGAFTSYELAPLSDGDDDDDGLPDEWEVQHFGGLYRPGGEPAEDWDGDGFGNEAEFLSGTDPADEADRFLLDFDAVAPTTVVRFATRRTGLFQEDCDRYYALDVATNLTPPEWSAVADYTNILGADQLVTCTNVLPEAAPVFYRGRVRIERR
jgi:hypothetical protein